MESKHLNSLILVLVMVFLFSGLIVQTAEAAPNFANDKFKSLWEYSDKPVDEIPGLGRGYTWGPNSFGTLQEDYQEAAGGNRQVQYFDKSRMELSPDGSFVTNGLLTKELVTGNRQDGDAKFSQLTPSTVQVAGDDNSNGGNVIAPTYASFKQVVTINPGENTAPNHTGQLANLAINKAGAISTVDNPPAQVQIGYFEPVLGHNVPKVFQDYQNLTGRVWNGSQVVAGKVYTNNPTANVFGYPISESFWARAVVAGQEKDVLIQLYERRVLTFTPSNPAGFQVEMGNIGQHYYQWRYTAPTPPIYEVNGQWYGLTAQGLKMQFTIANNFLTSINVWFSNSDCSVSWKTSFANPQEKGNSLLVKGDGFAVALDNWSFSGTFNSANLVTGKFVINNNTTTCVTSADTTWTATRIGMPLPAGKYDGYWDWSGSGMTLSFEINHDILTSYYIKVTCGNNSSSISDSSASVLVIDNSFTAGYSKINITGTFNLNGTATGSLKFAGDNSCGSTSSTWTAQRTPFSPYDGNWRGTTYQNNSIKFNVKKNVVSNVSVGLKLCGSSNVIVFTFVATSPINNNTFGISVRKTTVTGTFADQQTATGNLLINTTDCPLQGVWRATKVNPFEP